jgi:hypothetical protein
MMNMYVMLILVLWNVYACLTSRGVTVSYGEVERNFVQFEQFFPKVVDKDRALVCDNCLGQSMKCDNIV